MRRDRALSLIVLAVIIWVMAGCGSGPNHQHLDDLSTAIIDAKQATNAATAAVAQLTIAAATQIAPAYGTQAANDCRKLVDRIGKGDYSDILPNATLPGCDFTKINLFGMDMSQSDLRASNMDRVDLTDANLIGSDLRFAILTRAKLIRANLESSILANANLSNANLTNANLRNADLTNATLKSADFSSADLTGATLWDADLRSAKLATAIISQDQINQAKTTKGAILPEGMTGK